MFFRNSNQSLSIIAQTPQAKMQGKTNKSEALAERLRQTEQEREAGKHQSKTSFLLRLRDRSKGSNQISGGAENLSWAKVVMKVSR